MHYFTPSSDTLSSDPSQREIELKNRIQAIEADLANPLAFPLGEKSVNRVVLQGILKFWTDMSHGCTTNQITELLFPHDRETINKILALMEGELSEIRQRILNEAMPERLVPGAVPKALDATVLISVWSQRGLEEIMEQLQRHHRVGPYEEEESALDC